MVAPPMVWSRDRDALHGRVAVVAGATRGAGRGIAAALGEAGATVVCKLDDYRQGALRPAGQTPRLPLTRLGHQLMGSQARRVVEHVRGDDQLVGLRARRDLGELFPHGTQRTDRRAAEKLV